MGVFDKIQQYSDELQTQSSFSEPKEQPSADRPALPTEMNGVKISDAIKWADEWLNEYATGREWSCVRALRDFTETALMELSPADRPSGEWQKYKGGFMCSNCKTTFNYFEPIFNYCPDCGAKMKSGNK